MTRITSPKPRSRRRSRAVLAALRREPTGTVSRADLAAQGRESARRRGPSARRRAARKAARTRQEQPF